MAGMNLFGFEIKKKDEEYPSFAPKVNDDGAVVVEGTGLFGTYLDIEGSIKTEAELVSKYREISIYPEMEEAIDDIVNEAIIDDNDTDVVEIILDEVELSDNIKKRITDEFKYIGNLLQFGEMPHEIFRRWYVDGRLYYHAVIDENAPQEGLKELRYIDPRNIRKVREVSRKSAPNVSTMSKTDQEYYIYSEKGFTKSAQSITSNNTLGGIRIAKDSIIHCTSGKTSPNGDLVQSHVHKAIRPFNQLRLMEDALVIYRISRAPERRVFYVDVSDMPKMKAEQYLRDTMNRFKNKVIYDSNTGEVRNTPKYMTMLEDFWLPRRSGGKSTEITTLPGGSNLSQLDDIEYFQNKLYKALNVPITRLNPELTVSIGRSNEITRDEIKFSKFIARLRKRFATLFLRSLQRQLILKGVMNNEDWEAIEQKIKFRFSRDNYWAELKEAEIMRERLGLLGEVYDYANQYYSHEEIRKNILRQTDEDIERNDAQIKKEANNIQYHPELVEPPEGSENPTEKTNNDK